MNKKEYTTPAMRVKTMGKRQLLSGSNRNINLNGTTTTQQMAPGMDFDDEFLEDY